MAKKKRYPWVCQCGKPVEDCNRVMHLPAKLILEVSRANAGLSLDEPDILIVVSPNCPFGTPKGYKRVKKRKGYILFQRKNS